jgi:hypothetical protein
VAARMEKQRDKTYRFGLIEINVDYAGLLKVVAFHTDDGSHTCIVLLEAVTPDPNILVIVKPFLHDTDAKVFRRHSTDPAEHLLVWDFWIF